MSPRSAASCTIGRRYVRTSLIAGGRIRSSRSTPSKPAGQPAGAVKSNATGPASAGSPPLAGRVQPARTGSPRTTSSATTCEPTLPRAPVTKPGAATWRTRAAGRGSGHVRSSLMMDRPLDSTASASSFAVGVRPTLILVSRRR